MQIRVENLRKEYGRITAVDIPSLEIEKGQVFGLVGNNGAGKTTFLRLILDLVQATTGRVSVEGKNVAEDPSWKSATGSYLDESFLVPFLTAEEYFCFVGSLYSQSMEAVDQAVREYESLFTDQVLRTGKYIRNLSGGNKKKVGIIAALIVRPRLLVLDEPFANLDPTSQIRVKGMLKALSKDNGTTMVISSHNLNHVTEVCGRIAILETSRIVRDVKTEDATLQSLEQYFAL